MWKIILIVLALVLLALLAYAATRPDSFRIERSAVIKAAPEKIFPYINNLSNWQSWSPYEAKDPNMLRTLSGAEYGKGAAYAWQGNKNVGSGRMQIVESQVPSKVVMQLDFLQPFQAHNTAEFTLTPGPEGTRLVWAMYGPSPYVSKLMGLVFNIDKMVGADFEVGLAKLKSLAEK